MTEARRATLRDIAGALGLSVNTVSRALADKDSVSAATRAAVRAEAARIGTCRTRWPGRSCSARR